MRFEARGESEQTEYATTKGEKRDVNKKTKFLVHWMTFLFFFPKIFVKDRA